MGRFDLLFKSKLTDSNEFLYDLDGVTEDNKTKNIINEYREEKVA